MIRDHYILDRAKSAQYGKPVFRVAARHVANRYQSAWKRGSYGFKKWLAGGPAR